MKVRASALAARSWSAVVTAPSTGGGGTGSAQAPCANAGLQNQAGQATSSSAKMLTAERIRTLSSRECRTSMGTCASVVTGSNRTEERLKLSRNCQAATTGAALGAIQWSA